MSTPIDEGVTSNETGDEAHGLTGREPWQINSASTSLNSTVMSKEVARQIKVATDPFIRQLEWFCDLMKEPRQVLPGRNEDATGLVQRSPRPHSKIGLTTCRQ